MKLLLDTHIALWMFYAPARLPKPVVREWASGRFEMFVSLASVWEVAIKYSKIRQDGGRKLESSAQEFLSEVYRANCQLLPISPAHCIRAGELPYRKHPVSGVVHADPFDRMLVAQAMEEPMRLVTADSLIMLYTPDAPSLIEQIIPSA